MGWRWEKECRRESSGLEGSSEGVILQLIRPCLSKAEGVPLPSFYQLQTLIKDIHFTNFESTLKVINASFSVVLMMIFEAIPGVFQLIIIHLWTNIPDWSWSTLPALTHHTEVQIKASLHAYHTVYITVFMETIITFPLKWHFLGEDFPDPTDPSKSLSSASGHP